MKNLAGVETPIANLLVEVELAKAGIPAFDLRVTREREVRATIAGVFMSELGDEVVFTRAWTYWVVRLKKPLSVQRATALNEKWAETVRVDGFAGGTEPSSGGVYSYHVDTQDGLNALFMELKSAAHGQQTHVPGRCADVAPFVAEHLKDWAAPYLFARTPIGNIEEIARMEISALLNLGVRGDARLAYTEAALAIAAKTFGKKSQDARNVRLALSDRLRDDVRQTRSIVETIRSDTDRYVFTWQLADLLTKRAANLWQLGRNKEARSVKRQRDDVRVTLVPLFEKVIDGEKAGLEKELAKGPDQPHSMVDYYRFQLAFTTAKLSHLLKSLKRDEEAAERWQQSLAAARQCEGSYRDKFEKDFGVTL